MEGTNALHCPLEGGSCSTQCALNVDVEASSPTSLASPSLQCEAERGSDPPDADSSQTLIAEVVSASDHGDCKQPSTSPSHDSSNSYIAPHSASAVPSHLSLKEPQCSSECSPQTPSICSQQHQSCYSRFPPPRSLDANAPEFTPPAAVPHLQIAMRLPLNMQPVYTAHSEIRVSVCYQTDAVVMQGPCSYELVDTTLSIGPPPPEIVTANNNMDVSSHAQPFESGPLPFQSTGSLADNHASVGQHADGGDCGIEEASEVLGSIGFITPVYESSPMSIYNPPILANPHVGFLPPFAMPPPPPPPLPPPPPQPLSPCIPLAYPNPVQSTHPQQALTVYTHKHFHPQFGWKEHISRALLISGIPPHLTESQLQIQLEQWGDIRALHMDKLAQGVVTLQFFDLRVSRKALRDMQNQHLLRQQRFQEQLYAQNGMQFHNFGPQSGEVEQGLNSRGLLGGHVVWAQYIAAWSVPVPNDHNQGTLVLFNVGADVNLQRLHKVFEKYGDVRDLREAPTKQQHKFVEFYDTRDAEAAWAALNGQEVCGKCVKIEFSRQGGPVHKQKFTSALVHNSLVTTSHEVPYCKDSAVCGSRSHSSSRNCHQEWDARFFEGDQLPAPRPKMSRLPNMLPGQADCPNYGPSMGNEWCATGGDDYVNHMQGASSGPRREHSICRPQPKGSHVQVHDMNNTFALRPAGTIQRSASSTRGHPHFEYDEREVYLISGQPRTTLMIKNIPNKYSQQMLLSLLDHHCVKYNNQLMDVNEPESAYDFVYLPIDFKNRCNLGYAFVNFTSALATLKFYKAFHYQAWEEFNSRKICDIKYARVQGRRALENHFCNSKFACDTPDYLPVVFMPPRNGLVCPPPRAAAGLMTLKTGRPGCGAGCGGPTAVVGPSKPLPESEHLQEKLPDCDSSTIENERKFGERLN